MKQNRLKAAVFILILIIMDNTTDISNILLQVSFISFIHFKPLIAQINSHQIFRTNGLFPKTTYHFKLKLKFFFQMKIIV